MTRSSFKLRKCIGLVLGLFLLVFTIAPVFASQNVISSVIITNDKEQTGGYELDIDSTQVAIYKTRIVDEKSIIFELKNSVLSKNIATYYDDVQGIESVIVKQYGKNKVRIFVQGNNVADTELVFINSIYEPQEVQKSIIINRPISQYQSTHTNNDLDSQIDNQEWDDNSFNLGHLTNAVMANLKDSAMGFALIFALVFVTVLAFIKGISRKYTQEGDPLIGLNNVVVAKNMPSAYSQDIPKMPQNAGLESVSSRSETIKQAQKELAKAHQKYQAYLQEKYKNNIPKKASTVNVDAIKKGIALSQYQKSSSNPYKNQEVIKMNEAFSKIPVNNNAQSFQIPPRPKKEPVVDFSSPYIKKSSQIEYNPKPKSKENMRFLESVTKIYEQSGRGDLANGLKNSMSKVR